MSRPSTPSERSSALSPPPPPLLLLNPDSRDGAASPGKAAGKRKADLSLETSTPAKQRKTGGVLPTRSALFARFLNNDIAYSEWERAAFEKVYKLQCAYYEAMMLSLKKLVDPMAATEALEKMGATYLAELPVQAAIADLNTKRELTIQKLDENMVCACNVASLEQALNGLKRKREQMITKSEAKIADLREKLRWLLSAGASRTEQPAHSQRDVSFAYEIERSMNRRIATAKKTMELTSQQLSHTERDSEIKIAMAEKQVEDIKQQKSFEAKRGVELFASIMRVFDEGSNDNRADDTRHASALKEYLHAESARQIFQQVHEEGILVARLKLHEKMLAHLQTHAELARGVKEAQRTLYADAFDMLSTQHQMLFNDDCTMPALQLRE